MKPLADRMRPQTIDEIVGQDKLLGIDAPLRRVIQSGTIPSMILWGPSGVGKTTLAQVISNSLDRPFFQLSAISSGVKDVRQVIKKAKESQFFDKNSPILFIDEIHRFSKSQQDALLGAVEDGTITLIGATTENPSFEVNSPLLSRMQIYTLKSLEKEDLKTLIERALERDFELKAKEIKIVEYDTLLRLSGGDARKMLNLLEMAIQFKSGKEGAKIHLHSDDFVKVAQQQVATYDKGGEQHYDIISAFIKSIRGSDPQASIYWLARMLDGGEDIKFIARRLIISAAEDIGLANPNALLMANQCTQAIQFVGMPEARIILSEATVYLATSPKSNSTYKAINKAMDYVKTHEEAPVPLHLRNAPTKLMKKEDYGKGYKYPHDFPQHYVEQEYLPQKLKNQVFYRPADNAMEKNILHKMRKVRRDHKEEE